MTFNQNYRQIRMDVHTSSSFSGSLIVEFYGGKSVFSLTSPSSSDCTTALMASGRYGDLSCDYTEISSTHYRFNITVYSWPVNPVENNLRTHNGNPAVTDFYCQYSLTTSSVYCSFEDIEKTNIRGTYY